MTGLPDDVQITLDDLETLGNKALLDRWGLVLDAAKTAMVKIERMSAPITICGDHAHRVKYTESIPKKELVAWLENVASPLKLYQVHEGKIPGTVVMRVCECTGPPTGLEALARAAE